MAASEGAIIATPAFRGGPSGLIKNALDYVEELRADSRPYLDGRAVARIVFAAGWQASATTLVAIRSTIHALRGGRQRLASPSTRDRCLGPSVLLYLSQEGRGIGLLNKLKA